MEMKVVLVTWFSQKRSFVSSSDEQQIQGVSLLPRFMERQREEQIKVPSNTRIRNGDGVLMRPRGDESVGLSLTLTDQSVLHCNICLDPLKNYVYQCEKGHVVCSPCCCKMENKCAICGLPIGHICCTAFEKILQSVEVYCRHGCNEKLPYSKKDDHEGACKFVPC